MTSNSRLFHYCIVPVQTGVVRLAVAVRMLMGHADWRVIKRQRSLGRMHSI